MRPGVAPGLGAPVPHLIITYSHNTRLSVTVCKTGTNLQAVAERWHLLWFSAAVAHLFHRSVCWSFRDALLTSDRNFMFEKFPLNNLSDLPLMHTVHNSSLFWFAQWPILLYIGRGNFSHSITHWIFRTMLGLLEKSRKDQKWNRPQLTQWSFFCSWALNYLMGCKKGLIVVWWKGCSDTVVPFTVEIRADVLFFQTGLLSACCFCSDAVAGVNPLWSFKIIHNWRIPLQSFCIWWYEPSSHPNTKHLWLQQWSWNRTFITELIEKKELVNWTHPHRISITFWCLLLTNHPLIHRGLFPPRLWRDAGFRGLWHPDVSSRSWNCCSMVHFWCSAILCWSRWLQSCHPDCTFKSNLEIYLS